MRYHLLNLALFLAACSSSDFSGSSGTEKIKKKPITEPADDGKKDADDPGKKDRDDAEEPNDDSDLNQDQDQDAKNGQMDGDGEDTKEELDEEDESLHADVDLPLNFQAFQGEAADTNCISVQVNKQAPVEMGCNKGANQFAAKTLKAKAKPFCNVIRMIDNDKTSGAVITTKEPAHVRWGQDQTLVSFLGMRVFEPTPGTIKGEINDNGDTNAHVDVSFQISGLSAIAFTIENSGQGCKTKVTIP